MLTERQTQIAELIMQGLTNKQIGQALGISEGTVKIHAHSIFEKMGVQSRVALLLKLNGGWQ